ncbi:MAG: transcription-repair coupling factor [Candidatus Dadabacteria bacterium]|nr:MAG: transcription-repair coupling factor [Candidatus Dadabacteria bacterium]
MLIKKEISTSKPTTYLQTTAVPAHSAVIASLSSMFRKILVICKDLNRALELSSEITLFGSNDTPIILPSWDTLPFEPVSPQSCTSAERIKALLTIKHDSSFVAIVPTDSMLQRVLPPDLLKSLSLHVSVGDKANRDNLIKSLELRGYSRVSLVEESGEYAVRGYVVDFFPPHLDRPIRIEIFDGLIDAIKHFSPATQLSQNSLQSVDIVPASESLSSAYAYTDEQWLNEALNKIKKRALECETRTAELRRIIDAIKSGRRYPGIELIDYITFSQLPSIFDLVESETLIVIDNPLATRNALDNRWEFIIERAKHSLELNPLTPTVNDIYIDPHSIEAGLSRHKTLELGSRLLNLEDDLEVIDLPSSTLDTFLASYRAAGEKAEGFKFLTSEVKKWLAADYKIALVAQSDGRIERLKRLFNDYQLQISTPETTALEWLKNKRAPRLAVLKGFLSRGFVLEQFKSVFVSDHEIFAERGQRRSIDLEASSRNIEKLLSSIARLNEGDYVVHSDYGIGIYRGLKHRVIEGAGTDLLQIEYADSQLFLPIQHIAKIEKFVAAEGAKPALDKLGSTRWQKTKRKVYDSVIALAGDLIRLYAARETVRRPPYPPIGSDDCEFANSFPYIETPDQARAIEETLADLSKERPMDRLVCGDVGFGKTEVALRAAYKCVQEGKQVALLAPTTILVEQHFETFRSRFMDYPVKVGAISRFYSAKKNKDTLEALSRGQIDIIIGTHRLLSRDVSFHDLGLLIIDEEHRFGVRQKEKLKQMRKNIDVLTLTATPIPRTLHMSLLGIRDISIINTPPSNRRLIRTYLAQREDGLIRDALLRELQRGGQSFYVHNRVESIAAVTAGLRRLVPEARFEFGHGQMSEAELEKIMQRFLNKEIDVLVSTTIIESGLDIPNANTIIIDRADRFGLAQLYQLRGRVGRSDRQAYAYLLIPPVKKLGADAIKRLEALQSLDDVGRGFNLAIHDLEIRGAGNLLGKEQSGAVLSVGFELYSKILKKAVADLKGDQLPLAETVEPEIKLAIDAYIPDYFIPDISERLVLYQRLASLQSPEEGERLAVEIRDRFGRYGREVFNLLEIMKLRSVLRQYGVELVEMRRGKIAVSFHKNAPIDADAVLHLVKEKPSIYSAGANNTLYITPHRQPDRLSAEEYYNIIENVLKMVAPKDL